MRSKINTLLLCLLLGISLQAQEAEIAFKIKNAGLFVDGTFDTIRVEQNFNPQDLSTSSFKATIPVSSLYTGIRTRDRHLLKEKYFDAENYPNITFESTQIELSENGYQLTGDLTIKATTRSVVINFSIENDGSLTYYKGYLELDRKDYDVGKNHLILGDLVRITIQVPAENLGT